MWRSGCVNGSVCVRQPQRPVSVSPVTAQLGELRATFGHELKLLDDLFDLDMEDQLRGLFPSIDEP
jgi:hypothetical protein